MHGAQLLVGVLWYSWCGVMHKVLTVLLTIGVAL